MTFSVGRNPSVPYAPQGLPAIHPRPQGEETAAPSNPADDIKAIADDIKAVADRYDLRDLRAAWGQFERDVERRGSTLAAAVANVNAAILDSGACLCRSAHLPAIHGDLRLMEAALACAELASRNARRVVGGVR